MAIERCRPAVLHARARLAAVALLVAGAFLAAGGCGPAGDAAEFHGATMGTRYAVKVARLPPGIRRAALAARIEARLEHVNACMSTYRPDSELSRFNRSPSTDWFPVSADTVRVVHAALEVSRVTDGAFDVTVGPLVNLWSFGPEPRESAAPEAAAIAERLGAVGWSRLEVRLDPPALRKLRGDLQVDLAAIAKGYGVDVLAGLLEECGGRDYLVEIGGEVRLRGNRADGTPWTVGIEAPDPERRRVEEVLVPGTAAVATSGDYRNFFEQDGERYSHTIDPRTGRPIRHALAAVTVVTDTCMRADALATALMVLGPGDGSEFAVRQGLAALFFVHTETGIARKTTPAFEALAAR
ncbi:MAG: FAD:protein FMN transferase [Planctomycetes bacterium]|nr:FAD:protein FMN transferase [Planctomycetota bacterium]